MTLFNIFVNKAIKVQSFNAITAQKTAAKSRTEEEENFRSMFKRAFLPLTFKG